MTIGATLSFTNPPPGKRPPLGPVITDRRRYIHFYGEAFSNAADNQSFDVLAGDQPPTVTDGYAQWAQVQRPLRTGLVVYTGRNPISMQVSVRFMLFDKQRSWLISDAAGVIVEEQIALLEWMAGEGIDVGPSPIVYLTTYDGVGNTNPLIPFQYQNGTKSVPAFFGDHSYAPRWVITGLTMDTSPIRTANGYRVRQDATVTATMYEAPAGSPARGQPRPKGKTVVSRAGADTALKIARTVPAQDPWKTATAIIQAPQNASLHLRLVNQTVKHGKRVYVPASING